MIKFSIIAGAILAGLSVTLGAFGAHALVDTVSTERLETWNTAAKYLMSHSQALILVGILAQVFKKSFKWTAILLFSGTCVFSSSLFLLVITNTSWLGAIAPIGGFLMISGWLSLAATCMNQLFPRK
tara:strand:+ start:53 stop:433 length:381 start_codon:yes stop_codon:yes gene_type:complete